MKEYIQIVFCYFAACTSAFSQSVQFKNYPINNTGYSALFPADPGPAEESLSDSELKVYSSEVDVDSARYGLVMVLLEDNFANSDKETLEGLLVSYMEFLKLSFDISSGIGGIKNQVHAGNPEATGIQDFWEDETGAQWAVRGWIAKDALAVLYVHSSNPQDMSVPYNFLDGFEFKKKAIAQGNEVQHISVTKGKKK